MTNETMIELIGVQKSFGDFPVLKDITLNVKRGDVVALIGPSGSGKSTLLRSVNLLTVPEKGFIRVGSQAIDFSTTRSLPGDKELASFRARTGMVFQSFNLFPHMTVEQNVMEGPVTVLRTPKAEAKAIAHDLLTKVGLADKATAQPGQSFRRTETAGRHCPGARHETRGDVVRRSHVGTRSRTGGRSPVRHPIAGSRRDDDAAGHPRNGLCERCGRQGDLHA